jgi:hypothetical protein
LWRFGIVVLGAILRVVVGVAGTFIPVAGNLFGPVAGGMVGGVGSRADHPVVDGVVAALVGGVAPAFLLAGILQRWSMLPSVPGQSVAGLSPEVLALTAVCGVVGAVAAQFPPEPTWVHPMAREGT